MCDLTIETIAKGVVRGNAWTSKVRTRFGTMRYFSNVENQEISIEDIAEEVYAEIMAEAMEEEWIDESECA